jgi:hypothetical protein
VLLVSTVGVPLMVHVLLSKFKPVGKEGEMLQVSLLPDDVISAG